MSKRAPIQKTPRRVIDEARVIHLSPADQRMLVRAILNPPPPGANLRRAALAYQNILGSNA